MLISDEGYRADGPNVELAESGANPSSHRRLLAGLIALAFVWRLYFVFRFPFYTPDSSGYDHLARNWLTHHVYGLEVGGHLVPVDFRLPGYPAILAVIYTIAGFSLRVVMVTQAAIDSATCLLAGRLARSVAPHPYANQAEAWTVGIAAVCPFLPCYAAAVLSEVPATFFVTAVLVTTIAAFERNKMRLWLACGALTGIATLIRPESGLIVVPLGIGLLVRHRQRAQWPRLFRDAMMCGVGLGLTLVPWTIRNAVTMHEFQPLAPRYANAPGEYVPIGYSRWIRTWLVRMAEVEEAFWKLDDQPILIANLPDSAFDSPAERARVAALLEQYNKTTQMTAAVDQGFARIAAERIRRHPLRYYVTAPLHRAFTMWFIPRVETIAFSGDLWPPREMFEDDPKDFTVSLTLAGINVLLIGLAVAGLLAWRGRLSYADLLLLWILLRTAYLTTVETPEPRYVIECYPALFVFAALGVIAIRRRFHRGKLISIQP